MNEKKEKKNCSSYINEKISDDTRVSEFCVTNLTIEIEINEKSILLLRIKNIQRCSTLKLLYSQDNKCQIIKKKYSAMSESYRFCLIKIKERKKCFCTSKNPNFQNKIYSSKISFQNVCKISVFQKSPQTGLIL